MRARSDGPKRRPTHDQIQVFVNENDFLITSEDVSWLTNLFRKQRVTLNTGGGHMARLYIEEDQDDASISIQDLL